MRCPHDAPCHEIHNKSRIKSHQKRSADHDRYREEGTEDALRDGKRPDENVETPSALEFGQKPRILEDQTLVFDEMGCELTHVWELLEPMNVQLQQDRSKPETREIETQYLVFSENTAQSHVGSSEDQHAHTKSESLRHSATAHRNPGEYVSEWTEKELVDLQQLDDSQKQRRRPRTECKYLRTEGNREKMRSRKTVNLRRNRKC